MPGQEPSLTHTARVFWTTENGVKTEIQIRAAGDRPTQFSCWRSKDKGEKESLGGGIAPDCRYHFLLTAAAARVEGVNNIVGEGCGVVEVRGFGFVREAFDSPPEVSATYTRDGIVVGESKITAEPVPEKLLKGKVEGR